MLEYQMWRFPLCEVLWFPFIVSLLHPHILIKNCSYPQSTFFLLQCTRKAFTTIYQLTDQPTNQPTNSMKQSPSWEANRFSGSQVIPRQFMEHGCSTWHLWEPATCPCPEPSIHKNCKIIKIKTKKCEEVELFNLYKIITNFCLIMERSVIGFFNIF